MRILQEIFILSFRVSQKNTDIIYSYFGYGFIFGNFTQVSGAADSNLYFPEINFWEQESFFNKIKRYLVDKYRIYGLRNSEAIIFENLEMFNRAKKMFPEKRLELIMPSFSKPADSKLSPIDLDESKFRVLCLSGWQKNKNILKLPQIAKLVSKRNPSIEFVITASPDSSECYKEFYKNVIRFNVEKHFKLIGNRPKDELEDLYKKINCVILLSLLESFSNNIIESWHYKKPLIISDESWSKSICNDAAIYVQRDDVNCIAKELLKISANPQNYDDLIEKGMNAFLKYPTIEERFKSEIEFLNSL